MFVDEQLAPFADQWAFLATLQPLTAAELEGAIERASQGRSPLDVGFSADEEEGKPWGRPPTNPTRMPHASEGIGQGGIAHWPGR